MRLLMLQDKYPVGLFELGVINIARHGCSDGCTHCPPFWWRAWESSLVCRTVVSRQVKAGSTAVTSRWSDVGSGMWMLSLGREGQIGLKLLGSALYPAFRHWG